MAPPSLENLHDNRLHIIRAWESIIESIKASVIDYIWECLLLFSSQ